MLSVKMALNLERNDHRLHKRVHQFEDALGDTMNRIYQVSDTSSKFKSNELVEKVLQQSEISSILPFGTNAEIEAVANDAEKKEAIVKYACRITPKNDKFHINIHRVLLKAPLLGRSYLIETE